MDGLLFLLFEIFLGIALIVSGFLMRKQKLKFLSYEYRRLNEIDKANFERDPDMDEYWRYIGNTEILAGFTIITAVTSSYLNNKMMVTILGILFIATFAYALYGWVFRKQNIKKKNYYCE